MAQTLTSGLTASMQTYYDTKFLKVASAQLKHMQFADKRPIPANSGKIIDFTRYTLPAVASTALTEGTNPTAVAASSSSVTAQLAEYGYVQQHSSLVSLTNIDSSLEKRTDILAKQAGMTLDIITREAMFTDATVIVANAKASITALAATDKLDAANVRKVVRTMKTNFADTRSDGGYVGVINEYGAYDLSSDTTWVNAHTYKDGNNLYDGEIGKLLGVRFVETNQGKSEVSTVTVYSNFFIADQALAAVDISGSAEPKMIVKTPGPNDTSNPLNMYSTVGWYSLFAAKVLNPAFIINLKCGATA
jgi:N4-gp56 family major capsid protein